MDFKALYQNSLKLTTTIDDDGIPPLEKGLEQLEDVTRSLEPVGLRRPIATTRTNAPVATDKANFLLASKGIDAEKLTKELQTFELSAGFEPDMPLRETDVEGYLSHHHEMILLTAMDDVNRRTTEATHDRMNQAMIDDFEQTKQRFLDSLGGGAKTMGVRSYPRIPDHFKPDDDMGTTNLFGNMHVDAAYRNNGLKWSQSGSAFAGSSASDTPLRMSQLNTESLMNEEMKAYYSIMKEWINGRVPNTRSQYDLVGSMEHMVSDRVPANQIGSKWEAVWKCWLVLQTMINGGDGVDGKTISRQPVGEHAFAEFTALSMDAAETKQQLRNRFAFGARVFLENQFRTFIQQTVQKQQLATGGIPDLLSNVRAFVRYLQSSKYMAPSASPLDQQDVNVWALMYYCLRCGGDQEAIDLVTSSQRAGDSTIDADVLTALRYRALQRRTNMTGVSSSVPNQMAFSKQSPNEYERLVERYHRLTSASMDAVSVVNPYERCVVNLLCYGNPNASEPRILTTIEDYLWQRLCFIQRSTGAATSAPDSAYTIQRLSKSIQKFGPSHFGSTLKNGNLSPFLYFEILLMTQEFEKAINYLASKGFLLEAVHFAITLQFYGLVRSSSDSKMSDVDDQDEEETVDLVRLVRQYVHSFQRTNAVEAAEYIASLSDSMAKKELLVELLLETRKFDTLAGFTSNTDGCRTRGVYDRLLQDEPASEIKDLISSAARKAEARGRPHDALALLKSVGDMEGVIALLNAQLSSVLSASRPEREEWFAVAKDFAEKWMRYPWVQSIANKYMRQAALAFQTLLNICIFMNLLEKRAYDDAMRFVDELDVLPVSNASHLTLCVDRFLALDDCVRQHFHLVLLGYLECLVRQSEKFKLQRASAEAKRSQIQSLREKAEAVVTFAGMIKFRLPPGTNERLHRMEAMIY